MGSSKKLAKGRLDKFYHLAKEQGFRSRAAFKLVQLNQKFNFLSSAHCVVDLCAAPGSWCQVAAKYAPVGSVIIGLDLVAIRPIRNVQTFAQDITQYDKCKAIVKGAIKEKFNHMVDVVLNDGAPNVGASWVKDAYTQTELVLCALRLACEILRPGGTFVSKVFRSQDYNSMMWVMNQFFDKVVAHKPSASRGVSAEIFVVCQGFKAPKKVDPKFFDPTHIFKEIQGPGPLDVLKRKKETKNREGYDPALGMGLFRACPVDQFVEASEPVQILSTWNKIDLSKSENPAVLEAVNSCKETNDEIRILCDDLKVLSKTDFKLLLRWRQKIEDLLKDDDEEEEDKDDEEEQEKDPELEALKEEEAALEAVGELTAELAARKRRLKKKLALRRAKLQRRIDMKMHGQEDVDLAEAAGQQHGLFDLTTMDADEEGIDDVLTGEVAELSEEEEEEEVRDLEPKAGEEYDEHEEAWLEQSYNEYKGRRGIKEKRAEAKKEETMPYLMQIEMDQEGEGEPDRGVEDFASDDEEDEVQERRVKGNYMLDSLDDGPDESSAVKAERFFSGSLFAGIEDGEEEVQQERKKKRKVQAEKDAVAEMNAQFEQATGGVAAAKKDSKKRKQPDWESEEEDEEDELLDQINKEDARKAAEFNERTKLLPKKEEDLAETLAFGELMLRKKQRYAIVDASYNRYAYNDDSKVLPDWFREDEAKFNVPEMPITKAQVARIKESWKAVDARPIKKVAEAKAKQKKRKLAAMAKLTKQATSALNNEEETSAKRESILKKLVAGNAGKTRRSKVTTVVNTKGGKAKGGSKGGKVKVVDKRMKKDSRGAKTAMRRAMKANHGRLPKGMVQQAKAMKVKNKHQNY